LAAGAAKVNELTGAAAAAVVEVLRVDGVTGAVEAKRDVDGVVAVAD
jgi:hypothetical protein